jgi:hypothetical protein
VTKRKQPKSRVVGAFVRKPEPLEPGKVRCLGCSKVVTLTKNGKIRAHRTPDGKEDCAYTATYGRKVSVPKVQIVIPPQPRGPGERAARDRGPSRLDAGSNCRECGKWIPGERSLCGACFAKRPTGGRG